MGRKLHASTSVIDRIPETDSITLIWLDGFGNDALFSALGDQLPESGSSGGRGGGGGETLKNQEGDILQ